MRYKMVVLDLDGTVVDRTGATSPRTRRAVRAARNAGLLVLTATGRRLRHALPATHALGVDGPAIFCNGALAVDLTTWRTLLYAPLRSAGTAAVAQWLRAGLAPLICRYTLRGPDLLRYTQPTVTPDWLLLDEGNGYVACTDDLPAAADSALKLMLVDRKDRVRAAAASHGLPLQTMITEGSDDSALLEAWREDVTKASAVRELAERAGVQRDEIVAFGDNTNDVELLAWAGLGVAMADGTPQARAAARIVCPPLRRGRGGPGA